MNPRQLVLCALMLAALAGCGKSGKDKTDKATTPDNDKASNPGKENTSESAKVPAYETPQAVFAAFTAAETKGDYKEYLVCLTPESQKFQAGRFALEGMSILSRSERMDAKDKERFKPILDVLARHGLTNETVKKIDFSGSKEKIRNDLLGLIKEPVVFAAEFMDTTAKAGGAPPRDAGQAKLTDLKIEGDKAKGVIDHKTYKEPMEFVKVGDGWKVAIPEPKSGVSRGVRRERELDKR